VFFRLQGVLEVSPVTGRLEPTYPAWKRSMFRYLVSVPVIFLCLLMVFIVMIVTLQLQVRVTVTG
jgi:anoctamin-8